MKRKKIELYEEPEMYVTIFNKGNVVTASGGIIDDEDDEKDDEYGWVGN